MTKFKIKGQMCPVCAKKIEDEIRNNSSIKELNFDLNSRLISASGDNVVQIVTEAVKKYEPSAEAVLDEGDAEEESDRRQASQNCSDKCCNHAEAKISSRHGEKSFNIANFDDLTLVMGTLLVGISFLFGSSRIKLSLAILGALTAGYPVIRDGLKVVFRGGGLDERFLMTISCLGAIIIGEPFEGAAVMILYRTGELITDIALKRANKSLEDLVINTDTNARIIGEDGISKLLDAKEVEVGTRIIVHPHEIIPLDSVAFHDIVVDNSSFTGESDPIRIKKGELVSAGAILLYDSCELITHSDYEHSSIFRMNKLLEKARASKSKQEKFLTVFARYYTPVVVMAAAIIAVVPSITGAPFKDAIYKSLSFLVTSCPCALVLGVPLSYAVGIGALSSKGILIKGSENIDTLSHVKYFAMDKTGTVTENRLSIEKFNNYSKFDDDYIMNLMAIGEKHSKHPIAQAFKKENVDDPENYMEIAGSGIDFSYANCDYKIRSGEIDGEIALSNNGNEIATFILAEKIKKDAKLAIDELKDLNVDPIIVSGDKESKVQYVADLIGVSHYKSEYKPEDKLMFIEEMKKKGKIAFVGDGINDAPVLKASDVGISMGLMGSDSAIESSDVVITDDSFRKSIRLIKDARIIMFNAKFIIGFVLAIKLFTLIAIYLGYAGMYLAVFADVGLSLLSVGIALLNLRIKKE